MEEVCHWLGQSLKTFLKHKTQRLEFMRLVWEQVKFGMTIPIPLGAEDESLLVASFRGFQRVRVTFQATASLPPPENAPAV